jgi:hypothetical protein
MPESTKPLLGKYLPVMRGAKLLSIARKAIPATVKRANQTLSDALTGRNQSKEAVVFKSTIATAHKLKTEKNKKRRTRRNLSIKRKNKTNQQKKKK